MYCGVNSFEKKESAHFFDATNAELIGIVTGKGRVDIYLELKDLPWLYQLGSATLAAINHFSKKEKENG